MRLASLAVIVAPAAAGWTLGWIMPRPAILAEVACSGTVRADASTSRTGT